MVDLADRAAREAALARRLGKAMSEARKLLLQAVEDGVVDENEWRAIAGAFQSAIQVELESTALAAGMAAAESLGVGVDSAALHQSAIAWARQATFELVSNLDARNRELLQATIEDYFSQRLTIADVEARLTQAFGPSRASTIAVTETTNAASAGEQAFARELAQMGLQPVLVINNAADDRVCPICGPLGGKTVEEAGGLTPSFHPNCRCWITTELREATR